MTIIVVFMFLTLCTLGLVGYCLSLSSLISTRETIKVVLTNLNTEEASLFDLELIEFLIQIDDILLKEIQKNYIEKNKLDKSYLQKTALNFSLKKQTKFHFNLKSLFSKVSTNWDAFWFGLTYETQEQNKLNQIKKTNLRNYKL